MPVARLPYSSTLTVRLPIARLVLERLQVDFVDRLAEQFRERMLGERVRLDELLLDRDADEVPPRLRRLVGLRLRRRGRRRQCRDEPQRRHGLYQHPFKDNVNRVSPSILAAVMTAPRAPIELREFPRPDLPPGAALLRTTRFRSLRHRRAPLARPAVRRAVSDHSRPRLGRRGRRGARPAHRHRRRADSRGRSRRVLRRASHLRPLPRLHRPSHADALRVAPRLRHHRLGRRGAVRRLGAGDLPRARRRASRACPTPSRSTTTSAAAAAC